MDIRIFDGKTLRLAGICDTATRVSAEECYDTAGRCSIVVPHTAGKLFSVGDLLLVPGTEDGFVVESIREDGTTTTVGGRGTLSFGARRIVTQETTYEGRAEALLLSLAESYLPPTLPGALTLTDFGYSETVAAEAGYAPLLTIWRQIGLQTGLGLRLRFLPEEGFLFTVRKKAAGGKFLSRSLGNLVTASLRRDVSAYANRAIVRGVGDRLVTVSTAAAGEPYREIYENAEDLAFSRYGTEDAYLAALTARGQRCLAAHRPVWAAEIVADAEAAAEIAIGDACPVSDSLLGIRAEAFCRARKTEFSSEGVRYSVTLAVTAESGVKIP